MAKGKKTGGRRAGTPNKATAGVKEAAQVYTAEAVDRLVFWMRSDDPKASVAATLALLDRGHGRAPQAITGEGGGPLQVQTVVVHEHRSA